MSLRARMKRGSVEIVGEKEDMFADLLVKTAKLDLARRATGNGEEEGGGDRTATR